MSIDKKLEVAAMHVLSECSKEDRDKTRDIIEEFSLALYKHGVVFVTANFAESKGLEVGQVTGVEKNSIN